MSQDIPVWDDLLSDYARRQDDYWPEGRRHQGRKFEKFLERFQKIHGLETADAGLNKVIETARARMVNRPLTVFLISAGSSGSHWLEAVLDKSLGLSACGEVYFPPDIIRKLRKMDAVNRSTFMDAVHIIHSTHPTERLQGARFVNSSHLSGFKVHNMMDSDKSMILLLRDPANVAISRIFRKPSYRKLFDDLEVSQFFRHNLDYVTSFFDVSGNAHPDITVKFEDMRRDLGGVIAHISELIGIDVDANIIEETVTELGYVSHDDAAKTELKTNVYSGPKITVPDDVREKIKSELMPVRSRFDYA